MNLAEALTLIPCLTMFILSIYFAGSMLYIDADLSQLRSFAFLSLCFIIAGLVLAFTWFIYWGLFKTVTRKR